MANEIELPDYLPSKYKSWLHLYLFLKDETSNHGMDINCMESVELYEHLRTDEVDELGSERVRFYHKFPIKEIKSRALDYVLSKLPDFNKMYSFGAAFHLGSINPPNVHDGSAIFNNLLDICPRNKK